MHVENEIITYDLATHNKQVFSILLTFIDILTTDIGQPPPSQKNEKELTRHYSVSMKELYKQWSSEAGIS